MQRLMDEHMFHTDYYPLSVGTSCLSLPLPDYRNENMCLELMLIAAAANT